MIIAVYSIFFLDLALVEEQRRSDQTGQAQVTPRCLLTQKVANRNSANETHGKIKYLTQSNLKKSEIKFMQKPMVSVLDLILFSDFQTDLFTLFHQGLTQNWQAKVFISSQK